MKTSSETSLNLKQALGTGSFWTFAIGTSFYGLVTSGTSLFNESILAESGFSKDVFLNVTLVGIPVGLGANLLGGWLSLKVPLARLFAAALALLGVALACFPLIQLEWQAYLYAIAVAAAGGVITLCFFSLWRRGFGSASLGRIQGAAQLLTVLFSAVGPLLFAAAKTRLGQYGLLFLILAPVSGALAIWTWLVPLKPLNEDAST